MSGRPATAPEGLLTTRQVAERTGYTRQHIIYLGQKAEGQTDTALFLIGQPIQVPGWKLRVWVWPEQNVADFMAGPLYRSKRPQSQAA